MFVRHRSGYCLIKHNHTHRQHNLDFGALKSRQASSSPLARAAWHWRRKSIIAESRRDARAPLGRTRSRLEFQHLFAFCSLIWPPIWMHRKPLAGRPCPIGHGRRLISSDSAVPCMPALGQCLCACLCLGARRRPAPNREKREAYKSLSSAFMATNTNQRQGPGARA